MKKEKVAKTIVNSSKVGKLGSFGILMYKAAKSKLNGGK